MANDAERRLILEMIDQGKITSEEALRLIQLVEAAQEAGHPETGETSQPTLSLQEIPEEQAPQDYPAGLSPQADRGQVQSASQTSLPPDVERWRRWWHVPLWVGVGITALSGLWMATVVERSGMNFWFIFAWLPFLLGVAIIVLAWESRTSHWLHLRIHQKSGEWPQKIAFSMPLPLRPASWFLRSFKDKIPGLEDTSVDELILALDDTTTPDNPLFIDVDEGDHGEKVQIYIA